MPRMRARAEAANGPRDQDSRRYREPLEAGEEGVVSQCVSASYGHVRQRHDNRTILCKTIPCKNEKPTKTP